MGERDSHTRGRRGTTKASRRGRPEAGGSAFQCGSRRPAMGRGARAIHGRCEEGELRAVMWSDVRRKLAALVAPPAGPAVRADGRVWHLSAEGEALFGSGGPAYERWLAEGSAEVVKHGPHRTVYRVALATGTVYVKHCRINGPRAWVREVIRPPKARL